MSSPFNVGIDVGSTTFAAAILRTLEEKPIWRLDLPNTLEGIEELKRWFASQGIRPDNSQLCMEATGVYTEELCYVLFAEGYHLAVEPPHHVKRAFGKTLRKNDRIDAQKIAEYTIRFYDELHVWQPRDVVVEQIKVLLHTREQLLSYQNAQQNALQAIMRKHIKTPVAEAAYAKVIESCKEQIKILEKTIKEFIKQNPTFRHIVGLLVTVPGVQWLFASHMLVLSEGFTKTLHYRQVAAFLGICPYERQSGTSVWKKPRSQGYGHPILRKLTYLASMSVRQHYSSFKKYFERKVREGKSKRLILNNIANKLIKLTCAVINQKQPYVENYISMKPC